MFLNGSIAFFVTPAIFKPGSMVLKNQRRRNLDSRLKISGMTEKKVVTPDWFYHLLFVTPAIFKPGSMVLKAFGFPIKDFGNDGGKRHP
ncbi:MAG: hypothetical protein WBI47_04520 [Atribacterales bacterium]